MEWTEQRIEMLRKLWGQGQTASQIATLLGGVTRNAVIGKAHRLGLTGRPSPIKREGAESAAPRRKPAAQRRQQPAIAPMPAPRHAVAPSAHQNIQAPASVPAETRYAAPAPEIVETRIEPQVAAVKAPSAPRVAAGAGSKSCSWPVGDPKQPGFHFCGDVAEPGRPYCAHHCTIAYHRKSEAA
ncbi:GcrA family cell cycle regulator [Dongia sp.]|uniref:GcrA family cell cycle regulator n=1 Tax=Dongia sp. TaxID=1977262 RepID=UPI0035AF3A63